MACSSSERPSRRLPSAARARTATAPESIVRFSALATRSISPAISLNVSARKLKKLRARFDRVDEIFRARGGENEDDALGRLFESFQQRVRSFVGELVRFVEDHHFVAARGRSVTNHFAQLANLVDAAIGGGVDFENVERSAGGNFAAGVAGVVRLGGGTLHAVERLGEDARGGGFAHAAHAGKNVGVRDAIRFDGVRERLGDVLLADNFGECLRAIFSSDDFIAHRESVTRNL